MEEEYLYIYNFFTKNIIFFLPKNNIYRGFYFQYGGREPLWRIKRTIIISLPGDNDQLWGSIRGAIAGGVKIMTNFGGAGVVPLLGAISI